LEQQIMDEHQNPEEAAKSGQDHLKSAASDLKEAAGSAPPLEVLAKTSPWRFSSPQRPIRFGLCGRSWGILRF
jgi:hypothetical protein